MNNQIRIAKFKYLTNVTNCVPTRFAMPDDLTKYSSETPFVLVATEDIYDNDGNCIIQKGQVSKEMPGYVHDLHDDVIYTVDENNKIEKILEPEAQKRFLSPSSEHVNLEMTDQVIDIDNLESQTDIIINDSTYQHLGTNEDINRIVSVEDIYKDGNFIVKSGTIGAAFTGDNKDVEFHNSWATYATRITNNTDSFKMVFDNAYVAQTRFTDDLTMVENISLTNTTITDTSVINYKPSDVKFTIYGPNVNHGMNLNNSTLNMSSMIIEVKNHLDNDKPIEINNLTMNYSKSSIVTESSADSRLSINNVNIKHSKISALSNNIKLNSNNISNSNLSLYHHDMVNITNSTLYDIDYSNEYNFDKRNNLEINNSSIISTDLNNNIYISNSTCYGDVNSRINLIDSKFDNVDLKTQSVPIIIKNSSIDINHIVIKDTIQDLGRYSNKLIEINQGELNTFDIGNYYEKSIKELEQKENSPSKSTPSVDLEL